MEYRALGRTGISVTSHFAGELGVLEAYSRARGDELPQ
jgi:hypothetical protein